MLVPMQSAYGHKNRLFDVLYVLTITKNLILVGQMVEKGLQVRFIQRGCFVEDPQNGYKLVVNNSNGGKQLKCTQNLFYL